MQHTIGGQLGHHIKDMRIDAHMSHSMRNADRTPESLTQILTNTHIERAAGSSRQVTDNLQSFNPKRHFCTDTQVYKTHNSEIL